MKLLQVFRKEERARHRHTHQLMWIDDDRVGELTTFELLASQLVREDEAASPCAIDVEPDVVVSCDVSNFGEWIE